AGNPRRAGEQQAHLPDGTGELQTPVNVSAGRARFKTSRLGDSRPFLCPSVRYDQITMDRFYARPSDLLVPVLSTKPEEAEGWVQCHLGPSQCHLGPSNVTSVPRSRKRKNHEQSRSIHGGFPQA